MIIVFDTKEKVCKSGFISSSNHRLRLIKRNVDAEHRDEPTSGSQPLLVVNASTSIEKNASFQRLVRSHVRKKYIRQESRDCEPQPPSSILLGRDAIQNKLPIKSLPSCHSPLLSHPGRSLDPFVSYPVPMLPYMFELVHNCGSPNLFSFLKAAPDGQRYHCTCTCMAPKGTIP
jgi:hypothetical protein